MTHWTLKKLQNLLTLILYYCVLKFLPETENKHLTSIPKWRGRIIKILFDFSGENIYIRRGVNFGTGKDISIGNNSLIGRDSNIRGPLEIGQNVLIAPELLVLRRNHKFNRRDIPIREQGAEIKPVKIEDDVWIGQRVTIMPGVTIGKGSIIATGAVVTRNIPPFEIWGGYQQSSLNIALNILSCEDV